MSKKKTTTHIFQVAVTLPHNIINGRESAEELLENRLSIDVGVPFSPYGIKVLRFPERQEKDLTYLTKQAANLRLHKALGWQPCGMTDTHWYHPDYSMDEYVSEDDFTNYVEDLNAVRELVLLEIVPLGLEQQYYKNIHDIINEDSIAQTGYDALDLMHGNELHYMITEASAYLRVLAIIRTLENYNNEKNKNNYNK